MCAATLRIFGELDLGLLRESVSALTERHEALRTRIVAHDTDWQQQIESIAGGDVVAIDLTHLNESSARDHAVRLAQEFLDEKVDLSIGPLFAVKLFSLSAHEHVLMIAIDHIISDAISCDIINRELWTLYGRSPQDRLPELPALAVQFGDYAVWQRRTYASWLQQHENYWIRRLRGARHVSIPTDANLPAVPHAAGSMLHLPLGKLVSADLLALAQREGTRLPLAMFAIYCVVMSHWCCAQDLVVECYMHGRHRPELESMLGFFAYPLHLCTSVRPDDSFLDLLHRASAEFSVAREHEDYGRLAYFMAECNSTDLSFNWLRSSEPARTHLQRRSPQSLRLQPFQVRSVWSVKFTAFFSHTRAGIGATVHYRSDLLRRETIERFGRNLRSVADRFVRCPESTVASAKLE